MHLPLLATREELEDDVDWGAIAGELRELPGAVPSCGASAKQMIGQAIAAGAFFFTFSGPDGGGSSAC